MQLSYIRTYVVKLFRQKMLPELKDFFLKTCVVRVVAGVL